MSDLPDFDLGDYDVAVFDLDGTVWLGHEPIPGAIEFLDECRGRGLAVAFATNINLQTRDEVAATLVALGLAQPGEHVVTASFSIVSNLAVAGVTNVAFVGSPSLRATIEAAGVTVVVPDDVDRGEWRHLRPGWAAVLAGWPWATMRDIETIGQLGAWGHPVYISSLDPGFPGKDRFEPGAGMMTAAARYLHPFEPIVTGKPSAGYAASVRAGLAPDARVVFFGDNQRADIGTAHLLGGDGVLILGPLATEVAPGLAQPAFVVDRIGDRPRRWNAQAG